MSTFRADKARFAKPGADWLLLYPDEMAIEALNLFGHYYVAVLGPLTIGITSELPDSHWVKRSDYVNLQIARPLMTIYAGQTAQLRRTLVKTFLHSMGNDNYPIVLWRTKPEIDFDADAKLKVPVSVLSELDAEIRALEQITHIPCPGCRCGADLSIDNCKMERLSRLERQLLIKHQYGGSAHAWKAYSSRLEVQLGEAPVKDRFDEQVRLYEEYLRNKGVPSLEDLDIVAGGEVRVREG